MVTSVYQPAKQAGNGATVAFSFAFKILATTDLVCSKIDAGGNLTVGTLGVDYTVVFDPIQETGTVTWTVAPVNGGFSNIARTSNAQQQSALPREGPFPAKTAETMIDKLQLEIQELQQGGVIPNTEMSGLYSARPAVPLGGNLPVFYYSTDRQSYEKWIPAKQAWILLG